MPRTGPRDGSARPLGPERNASIQHCTAAAWRPFGCLVFGLCFVARRPAVLFPDGTRTHDLRRRLSRTQKPHRCVTTNGGGLLRLPLFAGAPFTHHPPPEQMPRRPLRCLQVPASLRCFEAPSAGRGPAAGAQPCAGAQSAEQPPGATPPPPAAARCALNVPQRQRKAGRAASGARGAASAPARVLVLRDTSSRRLHANHRLQQCAAPSSNATCALPGCAAVAHRNACPIISFQRPWVWKARPALLKRFSFFESALRARSGGYILGPPTPPPARRAHCGAAKLP